MDKPEERLAEYDTLEIKMASRQQAIRKLAELKAVEKTLYKEGKLTKVPLVKGYAMTTYPNRFKNLHTA